MKARYKPIVPKVGILTPLWVTKNTKFGDLRWNVVFFLFLRFDSVFTILTD